MATRDEIVSVVDPNAGISWRYNPDEISLWLKLLGPDRLRQRAHQEIDKAIAIAAAREGMETSWPLVDAPDGPESEAEW